VAKAGYVECPAHIREILHGWEFHRWYVDIESDQLVFEEKPRPIHDPHLHAWFPRVLETDRAFEHFFVDNMERLGLNLGYDWQGQIKRTVRHRSVRWHRVAAKLPTPHPITRSELEARLKRVDVPPLGRNERIKRWLAGITRGPSDVRTVQQLESILCCPLCKNALAGRVRGELSCAACEATFPVVGNIYYLVPEQIPKAVSQPALSE
jgi:uncharacterized protein YbaR (Trm112 family)